MKVILLPEFYGHCPGLMRSIKIADDLIEKAKKNGKKVFYDVPLAHNEEVVKRLQKNGFRMIDVSTVKDADQDYFIVSAHGVSPAKIAELENKNFEIVSATCPTVTRLHGVAMNDAKDGYGIVIFGKADHPEVIGTNGCVDDTAVITAKIDDGLKIKLKKKTSVICQTTLPTDHFERFVENLKTANPGVEIVVRKTICPVVEDRVQTISQYVSANKPDHVVVVGSQTSSNTKQLATKLNELTPTIIVDNENEIQKDDFKDSKIVLVVSGTSAPPEVVERVADKLKNF